MKQRTHIFLLLYLSLLCLPAMAQHDIEPVSIVPDKFIAIDSIEQCEPEKQISSDSLRLRVAENPQNDEAWLDLANAYINESADSALITEALLKSISLTPDSEQQKIEEAAWYAHYFLTGTKSSLVLEQALQRLPLNVIIRSYLAAARFSNQDYDLAEQLDSINYAYILHHRSDDFVDALRGAANRVAEHVSERTIDAATCFYRALQRRKLLNAIIPNSEEAALLGTAYLQFAPYANDFYAAENEARQRAGQQTEDFTTALVDSALTQFLFNDTIDIVDASAYFFSQWNNFDSRVQKIAEECFIYYTDKYPLMFKWFLLEGFVLQELHNYTQASRYLSKAYYLCPTGKIASQAAFNYYLDNQQKKAIEFTMKAIAHLKHDGYERFKMYQFLSNLYGDMGNYRAAIAALNKALKIESDYVNITMLTTAYYQRAIFRVYQGHGRNKKLNTQALADLRETFLHGHEIYNAHRILLWYGWLLDQPHNPLPTDSVSRLLQDSCRIWACSPEGDMIATQILARHFWGDSALARQEMDTLISEQPTYLDLGEAACFYALQGDTKKAEEILQQAIEDKWISKTAVQHHPWLKSLKTSVSSSHRHKR
ncbi:hypothetical protein [Alloprevotella rava]|uniref:Tetratricopeptide (TPR) repeat protein n=1 Tax=Alloprevotella rava TaxID=671218 RepID=A0A7W5UWI0_9BACT|nr:hypothetical protein [Alloprevotella rava]MBB3702784.1 tetratricopeptide (TPR) repeat protein [Alloprevotella rava]